MFGDSKIKALYAEDDQRSLTDKRRQQHDIIKNEAGEWVLLRHADVKAAALDDDAFSSHVSRFLQIPNGLDGAEHDQYRALINRYLSQEAITPYVPLFQQVATELVSELPKGEVINAVTDIGTVFAVRAQCQWLGWPAEVEPILVQWVNDNHQASRLKDHAKLAAVAQDFNEIIRSVIAPFRDTYSAAASHNKANQDSITAQLCREQIKGRPLNEAEIVSILRNWTGGDLGSMALCVGVVVAYLAHHPKQLQHCANASDAELEAIIDEILRLDNPFPSNRRITKCPVTLGEHQLPKGAKVHLDWISANRDEAVFGKDIFDPVRHAADNLVYGIGWHVCPGRLLATWQLRILIRALLAHVEAITPAPNELFERQLPPLGGYSRVPVVLS
ncbi:cytochrome P450 [Psychrobacter raelei]|uniref:Cytochrome P450 n=1 Tax=Psychrobacter raelei TaxID=2565531 RepID=A0AAU6PWB3_9GAMM